jgi:RNA polymerase sigma factor (sigma-70 family)
VLFPEVLAAKEAGPNALTEPERQALVIKVIPWCRKLARDHADELSRKGRRVEVEEVESEAFLAATDAAQYYDPRRVAAEFITFVRPWVQNHLTAVTDPRYQVQAVAIEFPERIADRDDWPAEAEPDGPDADQETQLRNLPEPTRTIVRLSVFDRLPPGRIAAQLGIALKDVRLHLRNAVGRLNRAAESDAAAAAMFGTPDTGNPCGNS